MSKWRKFSSVSAYALAFAGAVIISGDRAAAQQVFPGDVVIQGSLCVGFDCASGESFGFDTIRLKENNTRIMFVDTSTTTGFPSGDWQLVANQSNSGGLNYFAIRSCGTSDPGGAPECGTRRFAVETGTAADAIYVASTGRVGFRTAAPVLDLHVRTSNTPGQRLEQDGSGGFSPQTWDIAGNEANFFVRDVTGGSRLPFRIRPGAPTSSLDIAATGRVGVGTAGPTASLHVAGNSTTVGVGNAAGLFANQAGAVAVQLLPQSNTNPEFWNISAVNADIFRISRSGTATEFELTSAGNLTIPGTITTGGPTCGSGCDLVFAENYDLPSITEHGQLMWENGYLPNVGPTPESEPIDLTDKLGRMLNELEKAHIYIFQLHQRIEELESTAVPTRG